MGVVVVIAVLTLILRHGDVHAKIEAGHDVRHGDRSILEPPGTCLGLPPPPGPVHRGDVRTLGISTSTTRGTVALVERGLVVAQADHDDPRGHAERLIDLLDAALAAAGWHRSRLDLVAVDVGPGSFTGVRVGLALAQGIALGLGIPVVGVGSLEAMARAAGSAGPTWALLDAGREEVFAACYAADGTELVAPRLLPTRDVPETCDGADVVGTPALVPRRARAAPDTDAPHAAWMARLGEHRTPGATVLPAYVRPADAELPNLARLRAP